jgi:hypothetical protein
MYVAKGHSQIINAIDGCGGLGIGGGAPEIATGSRDGTFFFYFSSNPFSFPLLFLLLLPVCCPG